MKHVGFDKQGQKTNTSICNRLKQCVKCNKTIKSRNGNALHTCFVQICKICKQNKTQGTFCRLAIYNAIKNIADHLCFVQKYEDKDEFANSNDGRNVAKFVYFDFETDQSFITKENEYGTVHKHVPNLCVAHRVCEICNDEDINKDCDHCGQKLFVFQGYSCLDSFCDWLFNDIKNENRTAIAHHARGFDGQFILQYLQDQAIIPSVISKGRQFFKYLQN